MNMVNVNKLSDRIAKSVLTVGCDFKQSHGGIAQVLFYYSQFIFPDFKFVASSGEGGKLVKILKMIRGLVKYIMLLVSDKTIDIVHIHTASNLSFRRSAIYLKLAKLFGKKVVLHIHGGAFAEYCRRDKRFVTKILNQADVIVCLSEKWKDFFSKITSGKNIRVINNVIPYPIDVKRLQDKKCHSLFLGMFCSAKGIYDLLNVIALHKDYFQNKFILHLGGNGEIANVRNFIRLNKLDDIVKYEGWLSGVQKNTILNISDIFILPSYVEGLPLSILEAMTYKMAIVTTDVGGIPEIVHQGKNGFINNPGDLDGLFESLKILIENKDLRERMGTYSWDFVQSYLPECVCSQLFELYKSLK